MKRNRLLKVLNPVLAILFVNQILTGMFADALPREGFEILHKGGGFLFALVGIIHVVLNWGWIQMNYFGHPASAKN